MQQQTEPKKAGSKALDVFLLVMTVLPFIAGMVLKILTADGALYTIGVSGAQIYFTIHLPLQDLPITESQVVSWIVLVSVFFLCLYLTHGITVIPSSKRQLFAEFIVEKAEDLVGKNMGERFRETFTPFISAIMVLSALSSLSSLLGLHPPTSDINVVAGWAILVFFLITAYKMKGGLWNYIKGFGDPIPFFAPFNVISEVATPVSMSFRHYGNVLSGVVISTLIACGLQNVSHALLGWLPGVLGEIPFLQIGIPAVLSLYFDLFSGLLQAFIFAMLTMLYISSGFPEEAYEARKAKKAARRQAKSIEAA